VIADGTLVGVAAAEFQGLARQCVRAAGYDARAARTRDAPVRRLSPTQQTCPVSQSTESEQFVAAAVVAQV